MKKHIFIKFLICMLLVLTMFSMSAFTYNNTPTGVLLSEKTKEDNTDPSESTETTTVDLSSLDDKKDKILNYTTKYDMYKTDGTEDIYLVTIPVQGAVNVTGEQFSYDNYKCYYTSNSYCEVHERYLNIATQQVSSGGITLNKIKSVSVKSAFYILTSEAKTSFPLCYQYPNNTSFTVNFNCTSELIYDHNATSEPSEEDPEPSQSTEPGESPEPSEEPGKIEEKSIIDKIAKWISDCIEQLKVFLKGLFNEKITLKATKSNALSVSPVMLSSSMTKKTCTTCAGKGTVDTDCTTCSGNGYVNCTTCNGTGRVLVSGQPQNAGCVQCGGNGINGEMTGNIVYGTGHKSCTACNGTGKKATMCTACSGNGYTYVSTSGSGTTTPGTSTETGIITIYDFPSDRSVQSGTGANITLTANATATNGASISYKWYVKSPLSSGFETDTTMNKQTIEFLNDGKTTGDVQYKFYVVCSADGCESKISPVMTLTILKDAANPSTSPSPSEGNEQASITAEITGTTKIKEGEYIDVTCEATASNGNECTYDWYAYAYGMYRRIGVTEARLYMLEDVVEPIKLRCLVNADGCSTKAVDFEIEVESSPRYNVTYKVMRKNSVGILTEVELGKAVIRAGDTIPTNLDFIGSNFNYFSLDKNGEEKISKDMKPTDDITVYVNYKASTGIDSLIDKASAMLGTVGGVCVLALGVVIFNKARKGVVNMQADSARATEARARRQAAREELKAAHKERKQERKKKRTAKKIERNWKKTNKPKKSKHKKHKK